MKTVRIYIETSFQRPAVRDGKYASALVFTGMDGDHELIVSGTECDTTYNRLTLLGAGRNGKRQQELPCRTKISGRCSWQKKTNMNYQWNTAHAVNTRESYRR